MQHHWTATEQDVDTRLDVFLTAQLPDMTRSAIANRIKNGGATVNDKPASVHRFLKNGDKISFETDKIERPKKGEKVAAKAPKLPPLKIIDETPDWIVINKPSGLLVHPDSGHASGTLVDMLVAHDPKITKIGEDPSRPGIMHRLDKEVSGLMVIAKTQDAFDNLKHQFAEHSVEKKYLALVHGEVRHDEDDVKFRIARSTSKARMAALPENESKKGKAAWTHYKVIKRFAGATLVELEILSGRTHQIRAHMHGLGHPVIGDTLYVLRRTDRSLKHPKLMLQSISLEFTDPATGVRKSYTLPPDPAFDDITETFKPHLPRTPPPAPSPTPNV